MDAELLRTTHHYCTDCGIELSKGDVEDGVTLCYGCWHWQVDYAEMEED